MRSLVSGSRDSRGRRDGAYVSLHSRAARTLYPPYPPLVLYFSVAALRPYFIALDSLLILLSTAHCIACLIPSHFYKHECTARREGTTSMMNMMDCFASGRGHAR